MSCLNGVAQYQNKLYSLESATFQYDHGKNPIPESVSKQLRSYIASSHFVSGFDGGDQGIDYRTYSHKTEFQPSSRMSRVAAKVLNGRNWLRVARLAGLVALAALALALPVVIALGGGVGASMAVIMYSAKIIPMSLAPGLLTILSLAMLSNGMFVVAGFLSVNPSFRTVRWVAGDMSRTTNALLRAEDNRGIGTHTVSCKLEVRELNLDNLANSRNEEGLLECPILAEPIPEGAENSPKYILVSNTLVNGAALLEMIIRQENQPERNPYHNGSWVERDVDTWPAVETQLRTLFHLPHSLVPDLNRLTMEEFRSFYDDHALESFPAFAPAT